MLRILCVAALACLLTTAAEARQRPHAAPQLSCADIFCWFGAQEPASATASPRARRGRETVSYGRGEIVAHPASCPRIAFCGCGAAVRVFGHSVRELWLAANWFRFPRAAPAPGMAAVRRHHVFVLEADLGGGVWEVYDANSGHHATRVHPRSIAGYTIVNPHGGVS